MAWETGKKYFPIKKDPACQLKWNWSTIWMTEGATNSCHRCLRVPIDLDNFDSFHNLPHKIKERKLMLAGKWPTKENGGSGHCNFCKIKEDGGGISDRINMLSIPNQYPDELDKDVNAVEVTPKILELFMNDTCNLKCTYCNTRDSSQWASEVKKHGPIVLEDGTTHPNWKPFVKFDKQKQIMDKTMDWIEKNGHKLQRLHLLGGETFYQSELQVVLDTLKKIKNRHLELNIVSNLMAKKDIFKKYIEQIKGLIQNKNIGRFDLTASIDGWGPEAEYARSGLKCDHFEELFTWCAEQKWIILNTNQTVTALTVKSVPLLMSKINEWKKIHPRINTRFSMVTGRPFMHPAAYGYDFWRQDIQKAVSVMKQRNNFDQMEVDYMEGQFKEITNKEPNMKLVGNLKNFLDILDQRRGTDWRKIYPYLDI